MQNWISDPLPLVVWLPFYLAASLSTGGLVFVLFGNRLIAGAVFMAFLIASYFQDPPAL
jgi:hypothetical protein